MKTIEIEIYQFSELSTEAKQKAINKWIEQGGPDWIFEDAHATFLKFAIIFGVKNCGIDYTSSSSSSWNVKTPANAEEITGQRLATYIWNNYRTDIFRGKYYSKLVNTHKDGTRIEVSKEHPAGLRHVIRRSRCQLNNDCILTGMCYDMDILEPMYNFLQRPTAGTTYKELIDECIENLIKSVTNEWEASTTDEYYQEHAEANGYEFYPDGSMY